MARELMSEECVSKHTVGPVPDNLGRTQVCVLIRVYTVEPVPDNTGGPAGQHI